MSALKVGDQIKDNDPRMKWRGLLTVLRIWVPLSGDMSKAKVIVEAGGWSRRPELSLLLRRIHIDGKSRKSGFSKVEAPDDPHSEASASSPERAGEINGEGP